MRALLMQKSPGKIPKTASSHLTCHETWKQPRSSRAERRTDSGLPTKIHPLSFCGTYRVLFPVAFESSTAQLVRRSLSSAAATTTTTTTLRTPPSRVDALCCCACVCNPPLCPSTFLLLFFSPFPSFPTEDRSVSPVASRSRLGNNMRKLQSFVYTRIPPCIVNRNEITCYHAPALHLARTERRCFSGTPSQWLALAGLALSRAYPVHIHLTTPPASRTSYTIVKLSHSWLS